MDKPRFHFLRHTTAVVVILMACCASVRAEDFVRQEAAVRLQQAQIERLENGRLLAEQTPREAKLPVMKPVFQGNVFVREEFHHIDHVVYGTSTIYGQQIIENQLKNKVQQLSSEYDLTETQQSKLLLAGQWEAKQFANDVDVLRQKYTSSEGDIVEQQIVVKQAQTLQKQRRMLFGNGSFLLKVMARTVTGEQLLKYQAALDNRLRLRHRSNVEGAIRDIERQVVIKISQQEMLVELLMSEIPPPTSANDYDEAVVKYQFSRIPEQKVRPIFNEGQWPQVRQTLDGFNELETVLTQQGLIEEEAAAAPKPATLLQQDKLPTDTTAINRYREQQDGKKP